MRLSHNRNLRTLFALLATGSAVVAIPAAAEEKDDGGFYVTGRVGVTLPSDFDLEGVQNPQAPSPGAAGAPAVVQAELGNDIAYAAAVGYTLPSRFLGIFQPSVELEYGNTQIDVDGGNFNGGNQQFLGDVEVQTFTINYQSDLIFKDGQRFTPFFGGGLGVADVDSNILYFPTAASAPTFGVTGSDSGLVFRSNAGVRFDLSDTIAIDARVRYQRIDGVDLERRFIAGGNDAFNADISGDFETVDLLAGVRFSF